MHFLSEVSACLFIVYIGLHVIASTNEPETESFFLSCLVLVYYCIPLVLGCFVLGGLATASFSPGVVHRALRLFKALSKR